VKTLLVVLVVGAVIVLWKKLLPFAAPLLFTAYLVYGLVRPWISRPMQKEIEVDDEPDDEETGAPESRAK
jgi:hypothetical protein